MAKSKEELISMIENDLVDPTTNKITGERVKARLLDMVDAMGTGGGGGAMEYWSVLTSDQEMAYIMAMYCPVSKWTTGSSKIIGPAAIATQSQVSAILAIGFDRRARFYLMDQWLTFTDLLEEVSMEDIGATQITEEEFYTI